MTRWLNLLGWLACVIYSTIPSFWLMIHPFASRWRARQQSPYVVLVPVWVVMWVVIAAITWRWRQVALYATWWSWVPALLLFAIGFWLYRASTKQFTSHQLYGLPEIQARHADQRLVTAGIRGRVRHPVYLAHLCEMLAWNIGTGLAVCFGLTAFALLTGVIMIRMEEKELEQRFGSEYRRYRQRVPTILPRVGTRSSDLTDFSRPL